MADEVQAAPLPQIIITDSEIALAAAERLFPAFEHLFVNGDASIVPAGRRLVLMPTAGLVEAARALADKLVSLAAEIKLCAPESTRAAGWSIAELADGEGSAWAAATRETIPIPAPQGAEAEMPGPAEPYSPPSEGSPAQSPAALEPPPLEFPVDATSEPPKRPKAIPQPVVSKHNGASTSTPEGLIYINASHVVPRAVRWLWKGRIPRGKVSIIAGDPGLGKSQVCAALASVVTNGGLWPVDRTPCEAGSVLLLSAEDDADDTIRPRLEAAGANISKVTILQAVKYQTEGYVQSERGFNLGEDLAKVKILLQQLKDVRLFIIDPVSAYLGTLDSHKNAEVRAMLAPLATLASSCDCSILLVSHLTKGQAGSVLARIQGSMAFGAAARAVWGVTKDHSDPSRRLFMPMKNNLGRDDSGLAYKIESYRLDAPEDDEPIDTSRVMWEPDEVTISSEEAFGGGATDEERGDLASAKQFLAGLLHDGPMKTSAIRKDAEGAGYSWATLRRAQVSLKIVAQKDGFSGPWQWALPSDGRH